MVEGVDEVVCFEGFGFVKEDSLDVKIGVELFVVSFVAHLKPSLTDNLGIEEFFSATFDDYWNIPISKLLNLLPLELWQHSQLEDINSKSNQRITHCQLMKYSHCSLTNSTPNK